MCNITDNRILYGSSCILSSARCKRTHDAKLAAPARAVKRSMPPPLHPRHLCMIGAWHVIVASVLPTQKRAAAFARDLLLEQKSKRPSDRTSASYSCFCLPLLPPQQHSLHSSEQLMPEIMEHLGSFRKKINSKFGSATSGRRKWTLFCCAYRRAIKQSSTACPH